MKNDNIGFIGLGNMGTPMAQRLLQLGFPLVVYDKNPDKIQPVAEKGAEAAGSIRETAKKASTIISVLSRPSDIESVVFGDSGVDGLLQELTPGKIFIDMSTSSLDLTLKIYREVEAKNAEMLDAPVSGGINGAQKGTLTFIVGGREDTFKKCENIFNSLGKNIHYAGEAGSGMVLKLLNNLLYSINMCAAAEVLTLGEKMGLELSKMVEVFSDSSADSYCLYEKVPSFVMPSEYDKGFSSELLLKDIELALKLGHGTSAEQFLGKIAREFFKAACRSGMGEKDNSSVMEIFRHWAKGGGDFPGLEIK